MKRILFSAGLLVFLLAADNGTAQTVNSQVGGVVQDASKALIPGVTITLTNTATSVTNSQLTNESGAYSFPCRPTGDLQDDRGIDRLQYFGREGIGGGDIDSGPMEFHHGNRRFVVEGRSLRLCAAIAHGIIRKHRRCAFSGRVVSLPMVKENVLDLVRITPGFRQGLAGDANTTFAGLPIGTVNTVRDGLTVTDTRSNSVLSSTANINPDLVGEIRIILAPVDAEQGRGNGQILIRRDREPTNTPEARC